MAEIIEKSAPEIKKISDSEYQQMLDERNVSPAKPDIEPLSKKPDEPKTDVPPKKEEKVKPEIQKAEEPKSEIPKTDEPPKTEPKKKLRDRIKGDFFSPTPKEEKKPEVNLTELQQKLADYEKRINDPDYKTWEAIRAKGKKSIDILQEVIGVNPDKMSDEEVFRYDLQKAGITDPEKIQVEMESFFGDSTTERARKKELETIRNSIRKDSDSVQSEFFNKITAPDPNQEKQRERIIKDAENFQKTVQSMVGQEIYGLKVTPDMAGVLTKTIENNELIPRMDDGSLDTVGLSEMLFLYKFKDMILDEIEKSSYANGVHEIADEVEATPTSQTQTSRPPEIHTKIEKGSEEHAKEVSQNLRPYNQ